MSRGREPGIPGRLYRTCLLAFPRSHRDRFGEEIAADFDAALAARREAGKGAATYVLRACFDAVRTGLLERWAARRGDRRGDGDGPPGGSGIRTTGGAGPSASGPSRPRILTDLGPDVRLALRALARSPAYTAAAVLVLALGIGANTAVFSALRTVILDPPPFPEPDRLVLPKITRPAAGEGGGGTEGLPTALPGVAAGDPGRLPWSWPRLERLQAATADVLDPLAGYASRRATLTEPGRAIRLDAEIVTPGYLELLGVRPALGRPFTWGEGRADAEPRVALLGHELWTTRFAGDPAAVGSRIVLNGVPLTVVGVLPAGFRGLSGTARAWVGTGDASAVFSVWMTRDPDALWMHAIGRLAAGVSFELALDRVGRAGAAIAEALPFRGGDEGEWGATLVPFTEAHRNQAARASVGALAGAAGLVLLMGVVNLATLVAVRAVGRENETALRLALGAGRWRAARALAVETALLAAAGAVAGILVAHLGVRGIAAAWPASFTRNASSGLQVMDTAALQLDGPLLTFALALSVVTALLVGLLPLARHASPDLAETLRRATSGAGGLGGAGGPGGGRRALVGIQMAVAVVLLVGAGLMMGTLRHLQAVPAGFDPERLLFLTYTLPPGNDDADEWAFQTHLVERVEGIAGVRGASLASDAPFSGVSWATVVRGVEGRPPIPEGERSRMGVTLADPSFLPLLGVRRLAGAGLDAGGPDRPPETAVINRAAAETLFGADDPLGRHVEVEVSFDPEEPLGRYRVVGVVEDVLYAAPDQPVLPHLYLPMRPSPTLRLAVRTAGEPLEVLPRIRSTLAELAPDAPVYEVATGSELAARVTGDTRLVLALLALFAAVAVLLAGTGVYGVVAQTVSDRRREIGIRMALGARARQVASGVLGRGLVTALAGGAAGLVGAWFAVRGLAGLVHGVDVHDLPIFAGAFTTLVALAGLASWLPARRAARVDPMETLRSE